MGGSEAVLAAAPLVVACVLLAIGAGAVRAALASVVCAALVAVFAFPVPTAQVWSTAGSLGPTTVEILVILLGGSYSARSCPHQGRSGSWPTHAEMVAITSINAVPIGDGRPGDTYRALAARFHDATLDPRYTTPIPDSPRPATRHSPGVPALRYP